MRILIFMSDNRNIDSDIDKADYNSLAAVINYEYCKKHSYDFVYYRPYLDDEHSTALHNCIDPNTNTPRHASWAKLLVTQSVLDLAYDYVIYIDTDCIFKNFNQSIEDFIQPYVDNDIIFLNSKPWGDLLPCAGFYVCKVCPATKAFLKDWYNFNIPTKNTEHAWEQDALWDIYKKYNIGIVDSWMFREEEGQFLRHVCSVEKEARIPYFKNFIQVNNIHYSIHEIKCLHFNTRFLR